MRQDAGLSQRELARRLGTSRSVLSAIESDQRDVSDDVYEAILRAARARPSVLLAAHRDELLSLAARYGLTQLRVFGSAARGDDGPGSDVDILAHLDDQHRGRPLHVFGFSQDAERILGFSVDLVLDDSVGDAMAQILDEAIPL